MHGYLDLLSDVLENGHLREDRTGTGTLSVFGRQLRFDLQQGFPLLTTKKLHIRSIVVELLWFLRGDTNVRFLQENGVRIWNEWADEDGNLGPVYGKQWRAWETARGETMDQIEAVMDGIRNTPHSRRLLVSAWNVGELPKMALAPCHVLFQFYVCDGKLSCQLYQRSVDTFLGLPFNIASYALLTHMIAQQCDLEAGDFVWTGGDVHLYTNHVEQARLQLSREPHDAPRFQFARKPRSIDDYQLEDFVVLDYQAHPHIKAPISV